MSYTTDMTARPAKPITVTLGPLANMVQSRVNSGSYTSASEVVRAGLRALQREEEALDALLKARVAESLADTTPSVPQDDVFAALAARHAARAKG